jgi:hypothetical protein
MTAGSSTKSNSASADPEVLGRGFTPIFLLFEAYLVTLIEGAQASALDGGDVNEHILAAVVRLNKPKALGPIEPLYHACRHFNLLVVSAAP